MHSRLRLRCRQITTFLLRWWGPFSCLLVVLAGILLPAGCLSRRGGDDATRDRPRDAFEAPARPVAPPARAPLSTEPEIGVFLRAGPTVSFTTTVAGVIQGQELAQGRHVARASAGGILLDGVAVGEDARASLEEADHQQRFRTEVTPPTGAPQMLALGGEPELHLAGGNVELIERVPLEAYLAGVLTSEMPASWPQAALEAQAIAARSYACAKVQMRLRLPWQLHWHYTVDMAYAGVHAHHSAASDAALAATRGMILEYRGAPVPALFNACSGGRTEAAAHLLGSLAASTGGMAQVMPVVDDPAAQPGAAGLDMEATHGHWDASVSYLDISLGLSRWAREHPERHLVAGTVVGVRITGRYADSGRVASVALTQHRSGHSYTSTLSGADFRMVCGPGVVRSTWWDRFSVLHHGLEIAGRGFGHGVGLSQVSAWSLAREGVGSAEILGRFYRGAELVHAYP